MAQKGGNKGGQRREDCCSFCGAPRSEVELLFSGRAGANICNKCIEQGHVILHENDDQKRSGKKMDAPEMKELLKPAEIKAREAKKEAERLKAAAQDADNAPVPASDSHTDPAQTADQLAANTEASSE